LFVDTQIQNAEGSIIISDTKSNLYRKHKETLEEKGYDVKLLDFIDFEKSTVGYNPFDYLGYDSKCGSYDEGAVDRLVYSICPTLPDEKDPFWSSSARLLISTVVGYTLDMLTNELSNNNNLTYASCLLASTNIPMMQKLIDLVERKCGATAYSVRKYKSIKAVAGAERTYACVCQFANTAMQEFDDRKMAKLFNRQERIRFGDMEERKTAVFLNISDTDRSKDKLTGLFYTQLFQELIAIADSNENSTLKTPVNIILDDFATNCYINTFSNLISVIRSRGISVNILLQSISQLYSLYSDAEAKTILNNCDRSIYLGVNECDTVRYFAEKADRQVATLLNMSLDEAIVFERGHKPRQVKKQFDFNT
jgi:type IV secretion system protein VirD4